MQVVNGDLTIRKKRIYFGDRTHSLKYDYSPDEFCFYTGVSSYLCIGNPGITTNGINANGDAIIKGDLVVDGTITSPNGFDSLWEQIGDDIYNKNLDGSVGIGLTNPSEDYNLHVSGAINSNALFINDVNIEEIFDTIQVENRKIQFNEFLSLDGLGADIEMIGLYATQGVTFGYTNTSTENTIFLSSALVSIVANGAFSVEDYANASGPLGNGINMYYTSNGTRQYVIGNELNVNNIKKNYDWNSFTDDVKITDLGTGSEIYNVNINFRDNGSYIILREGETFVVELNDNFSTLTSQRLQIHGFLYPNSYI